MSKKYVSPSQVDKKQGASIQEESSAIGFRFFRELVESLAIALVLAFMFKGFLAEAFVIPTGSMAVTLMGAHKDVVCPMCGYRYSICASEEYIDGTSVPTGANVVGGTCPICRFTSYFGDSDFSKRYAPWRAPQQTFTGDRLIVNKGIFEFKSPKRWDVTVFRYPGKSRTNYIKRLIGLEDETIRIQNGDVFVKKAGEEHFKIARKPSSVLMSMLQIVYDTEYEVPSIHTLGWPVRWSDEKKGTSSWKPSEDYKAYTCDGTVDSDAHWLSYSHIVPLSEDWEELALGRSAKRSQAMNPQLITDFSSYNAGLVTHRKGPIEASDLYIRQPKDDSQKPKDDSQSGAPKQLFFRKDPHSLGYNWVSDLSMSGQLKSDSAQGTVFFRLVKGKQHFVCTVDLATGQATLSLPGISKFKPVQASTPIKGAGDWHVRFANVDEQMRFWVDEKELDFGGATEYDTLCEGPEAPIVRTRSPNAEDLTPAAVGTRGAKITFDHIKLERDIYYIAVKKPESGNCDLLVSPFGWARDAKNTEISTTMILTQPKEWANFGKTASVDFVMGKDQFLMLGDNSAKSQDSRLWITDTLPHYVPRNALIGKAVVVYWPHGWPIPGTKRALVPNFGKMRFVE